MFQEALQFKDIIILCYNRHNIIRISGKMPFFFTWDISKIIVDFIFFVVIACVLNKFNIMWLFSNALQSAIIICLKFRGKFTSPYALVSLIDDDFGIVFKLSLFTSNIKKEVCGVLGSFLLKKIKM
jgi:hypothetical protein